MAIVSDPTGFTLAEARQAIRSKAISARELATAHLSAIASGRPLNAFITETPEHALAAADPPDEPPAMRLLLLPRARQGLITAPK